MWIFGLLSLAAAVFCHFEHRKQKTKLGWLSSTKLQTVEHLRELATSMAEGLGRGSLRFPAVVRGTVRVEQPIHSELGEVPCVFYRFSIDRQFEETRWERDQHGRSRQRTYRGSENVAGNERYIPFLLEGATGQLEVTPDGAEFVAERTMSRFERDMGRRGSGRFGRVVLDRAFNLGGRRTLGYQLEEKAIPVGRQIVVVGEVSDTGSGGELRIAAPDNPENGQLIVSVKSHQQLIKDVGGRVKSMRVASIVLAILGLILPFL